MKAEIINVTPQMAADWLSRNTDNRALRRTVVDGLKAAFARGEYVKTHQGIAFSASGVLLDGQHRLTAISELRDGVFPMLVTSDLPDEAFQAIDIGVKRTAADSLRSEDRKLVETARLIATICTHNRSAITPTLLVPIIDNIAKAHNSLMAFCATTARTWSAAPVRLAAVMSIMQGVDPDYVRTTYRSLVLARFDAMPPVAHALFKSNHDGRVHASDVGDMLSRCLVVFRPEKAGLTKVQIKDNSAALAMVRSMYGWIASGQVEDATPKKKAATVSAAKGVLRRNSISATR